MSSKEKLDLSRPIVYVNLKGVEYPARMVCTDAKSYRSEFSYLFLVSRDGVEDMHRSDEFGKKAYGVGYFKNVELPPEKYYLPLFKDQGGYFSRFIDAEKSPEEVVKRHGHKVHFVKVIEFEV